VPLDVPLIALTGEDSAPQITEAAQRSIEILCARVRGGDEGAVRELHARYSARLSRYALVICRGDEGAATEAVQNTFLKAIRSLRVVSDEAALWAWLARTCRTSAADASRRARRYAKALAKLASLFSRTPEPPIEDTDGIWEEALAEAMRGLDDEERALIDARYTLGTPLAEIAIAGHTSARAIEGRLARIREKLRQSIRNSLAARHHEA
jgi:RNA polymerase sigma factor (sigma-70 family)